MSICTCAQRLQLLFCATVIPCSVRREVCRTTALHSVANDLSIRRSVDSLSSFNRANTQYMQGLFVLELVVAPSRCCPVAKSGHKPIQQPTCPIRALLLPHAGADPSDLTPVGRQSEGLVPSARCAERMLHRLLQDQLTITEVPRNGAGVPFEVKDG